MNIYKQYDNLIIELLSKGLSVKEVAANISKIQNSSSHGCENYILRKSKKDDRFISQFSKRFKGKRITTEREIDLSGVKIEQVELTTDEKLERDIVIKNLKTKNSEVNKQYGILEKKYIELRREIEDLSKLLAATSEFETISKKQLTKNKESIWFTQFSDWHIEEFVDRESTNGRNYHDVKIHKKRRQIFANNYIKLFRDLSKITKIKTIVIHLGGDFINGWIHEENKETNTLTPIQACIEAQNSLIATLEFILNHTKKDVKLKVITNVGNHGRITKKYRYSNESQTSYETLIYASVVNRFYKEDRIQFYCSGSSVVELEIGGQNCRFSHGHQIRYNNGIGGVSVSLNRKQKAWDDTFKCDFNFLCHYHMAHMPNAVTLMNGSMVGYNGMATFYGFRYEPPQQSSIIFNPDYLWTGFHRILCEKI